MEPPQPPNCHQNDDGNAEASRTRASSAGRYIGRHRQCPICRFQTAPKNHNRQHNNVLDSHLNKNESTAWTVRVLFYKITKLLNATFIVYIKRGGHNRKMVPQSKSPNRPRPNQGTKDFIPFFFFANIYLTRVFLSKPPITTGFSCKTVTAVNLAAFSFQLTTQFKINSKF